MRTIDILWLILLQSWVVLAIALPPAPAPRSPKLIKRQSVNSYAPTSTTCPSSPLIRSSSSINPDEANYIERHRNATQQAWTTWLSSSQGPNLDAKGGISGGVAAYTKDLSNLPRVAIALSGGGLRAQLNGMGYLQGLDSRNSTAVSRGTGGFLQLVSYVAGLSGGSWAVGSLAINDWPTPQSLLDNTFDLSAGLEYTDNTTIDSTDYLTQIGQDLTAKLNAGYQVSLIDYWGRLLSKQYISANTTANTAGLEFSSIQRIQAFTSASYPFPLITTEQAILGRFAAAGNGTVWETNPYETGSWDEGIAAFTPTALLGSTVSNGAPTNCVTGFDNFGYMIGLSSAVFNTLSLTTIAPSLGTIFQSLQMALGTVLATNLVNPFPSIPNPFQGLASSPLVNTLANITLLDGGEDGQVIPLVPLLQPARGVDLILAVDQGSDTSTGWPAGYSAYATFTRFALLSDEFGKTPVPNVPSVNTFINEGLNTRPTFFGCNSTTDVTYSDSSSTLAPILAYIPLYPWTYLANFSGYSFQLSNDISQATLDNGFQSATMAGTTSGSEIDWPTCLACASLWRSFERSKSAIPDRCQTCMNKYCWNGTINNTQPADYSPSVGTPQWVVDNSKVKASSGAISSSRHQSWLLMSLVVVISTAFMLM